MLINYKNVSFRHVDDDFVLEGVNFTVEHGEFIYIIGKVGSGKSSLLRTFYGEMDIDSADEAMVLGRDMTSVKHGEIQRLRREMGIIFQDFKLLTDRTVKKNLFFVLKATGWKNKEDIEQRIEEVLTEVDMIDKANRMPHELSGGEQQRIAIARAVLNSPKLIVADEPTANLDAETAKGIMELLRSISQNGTAIVMSTHNTALIEQYPGTVYNCHEGRLEKVEN